MRTDFLNSCQYSAIICRRLAGNCGTLWALTNREGFPRKVNNTTPGGNLMEQMIAYCGLDCAKCPAYVATQAGDREALERTAAMWREQFSAPEITADSIVCDGCMMDGRLSGYCSICEIRACALGRSLATCAPCAEYDGCGKLAAFHEHAPEAKATLDGLRAAL